MKIRKNGNKGLLSSSSLLTIISLFVWGSYIITLAQEYSSSPCAMTGSASTLSVQKGGRYMTSHDTLNVVVVFVQFPDDRYDTTYALWPTRPRSGIYPGPTYLRTFIDSTRTQLSTNGNITHYFREMSRGNFNLIGTARFIVTPHSRQWYLDNNWQRWQINKEVLQTLDVNFDFAPFDKYKRYAEYDIRKESDTRVDDIFMIYRNIASEYPVSPVDSIWTIMDELEFLNSLTGHTFAEASLGSGLPAQLDVDGGLRHIYPGFPGTTGVGLGTTSVCAGLSDSWGMPPYRVQIHEFSHHWMDIGTNYGHNGAGFWGMLTAWGTRQNALHQCPPNSFERELVGWHAPDSIYATTLGVTLTDYVTTNRSIKIKVPGSNAQEFFRLEYHTRASQFDNPEVWDPTAKGLYIIHQTGITDPQSQLRLIPADGRWTWVADEYVYRDYTSKPIPVLKRSAINRVDGVDDSRPVNYTWTGGSHPVLDNPFFIHVYRDRATNELIDKTLFQGDGQDAFGFNKNRIFSPWSNPNSQNNLKANTGLAIEVVSEDTVLGVITLNIYYSSSSALALAPSKPQDIISSLNSSCQAVTNWAANIETDMAYYNVYRQLYYGSTTLSEVLVASNITGTTYTDNIVIPSNTPSGVNLYVRYKIEAVDNQAKVSVKAIGNPILLGTTSSVSGAISSNTTWSGGVKLITGNLTVNAGRTLTINSKAFLCFASGAALQVNGNINASNVSFQSLGNTTWNGITINGTVTSNLNYCSIHKANYAINIVSSSPNIENCFIDDADTYGIYITGSTSNPLISSNYIEADSACIIHYYGSLGRIAGNSFRNAIYGVYVSDGSPRYDYYNFGRNVFESSITRDKVRIVSGQPWLGKYQYFYAPASTSYNYIRNNSSSPVDAQYNYWAGGNLPIYFTGSGNVDRSNALAQPPSNPSAGPGWNLAKSSTTDFFAGFENASMLFYDGKYSEARDLFRDLTNKNLDSAYSSYSLNWYMLSSEQLGDSELQSEYLNSVKQNKTAHELTKFYAVKWIMKLNLKNGSSKNARSFTSAVVQGTKYDRELSLELAQGLFEYLGDKSGAEEILDKLSKRFTDKDTDEDINFIRKHMNTFSPSLLKGNGGDVESKTADVPVTMNMFDAYPNPFNPTTTIAYSLTDAAKVNITIYDILGSEVTTLVDDIKETGYYTTSFNASNLASGLYFARITINAQNQQPFIKTIKMMLTK